MVSVTGVQKAASDQSGLQAVDSANLVTGVQSGQVATVQANYTPNIAALQSLPGVGTFAYAGLPIVASGPQAVVVAAR